LSTLALNIIMMHFKKYIIGFFLVCALVSILGCGHSDQKVQQEGCKIENYTFNAEPHMLTFKAKPQRIVVASNSALDTLIAFGEQENILAAIMTERLDEQYYRKLLPKTEIFIYPMSKETLLQYRPDFILGWRRFFSDKQLGNTTFWDSRSVPAYIQEASGPIPALDKFPPCTIESEKRFIRNMGKIYRKDAQAEALVTEIDKEIQKASKFSNTKPKVLVVEFMGKRIEVFGSKLLSGDIVKALGGELVAYDQPFISKEELVLLQADIIFVVHHGKNELKELALKEMQSPIYKNIKAVREQRIYPLAYKEIVAPAVKLKDTISYMRECIYEKKKK